MITMKHASYGTRHFEDDGLQEDLEKHGWVRYPHTLEATHGNLPATPRKYQGKIVTDEKKIAAFMSKLDSGIESEPEEELSKFLEGIPK